MLYHLSTMGPHLVEMPKMLKTLKCTKRKPQIAKPQNAQNQNNVKLQNQDFGFIGGEREC